MGRRRLGSAHLPRKEMEMKRTKALCLVRVLVALATAAAATTAMAQQINGVPGSPSATMTLDGKQLPAPDLPFGGKIERNALQSKAWWPPRVVPPKDAPNILLIMTDDTGFGAGST